MKSKPITFIAMLLIIMACDFEGVPKKQKPTGEVWSVNESGDSILSRYSEKSMLLSYTTYRNGYKHGEAAKFYKNGKLEFKIKYANGYKNGVTQWYYETGKLYRITNYKDGKKNGIQKRHYENGKVQAEIPYVYGEVQPGVKEYTKSGKLKSNNNNILIEPIDNLAFENQYILKCTLSNGSKKVKFYRLERFEGGTSFPGDNSSGAFGGFVCNCNLKFGTGW